MQLKKFLNKINHKMITMCKKNRSDLNQTEEKIFNYGDCNKLFFYAKKNEELKITVENEFTEYHARRLISDPKQWVVVKVTSDKNIKDRQSLIISHAMKRNRAEAFVKLLRSNC